MDWRNTPESWGAVAITLHWLVAALVAAQFVLGPLAVLWPLSPTKLDLFVWHKSEGMLVLALVLLRLLWRAANRVPAQPAAMPAWERRAAHASHFGLYFCLLTMPLSGWVTSSASGVPFRIFRLLPLPALTGPDRGIEEASELIHSALAVALASLIVLHVGAALRHHFVRRDEVLVRMLPWLRRRS